MQQEAFDKLYSLQERMEKIDDEALNKDWNYLQVSDHFYYMSTKFFSDGEVHTYFNPYESPYEAFINYMNVLSDFKLRLNTFVPEGELDVQLAALNRALNEKDEKIKKYEAEIARLQPKIKEKAITASQKSTPPKAKSKK